MTHPLIAIAGILLVGAMYGANAPGARAETVTCNINDIAVLDNNGSTFPASNVHGTVVFNLETSIAMLCMSDGCNEHQISVRPTRQGFEVGQIVGKSSYYARIENGKYGHQAVANNGVITYATGVCY